MVRPLCKPNYRIVTNLSSRKTHAWQSATAVIFWTLLFEAKRNSFRPWIFFHKNRTFPSARITSCTSYQERTFYSYVIRTKYGSDIMNQSKACTVLFIYIYFFCCIWRYLYLFWELLKFVERTISSLILINCSWQLGNEDRVIGPHTSIIFSQFRWKTVKIILFMRTEYVWVGHL